MNPENISVEEYFAECQKVEEATFDYDSGVWARRETEYMKERWLSNLQATLEIDL